MIGTKIHKNNLDAEMYAKCAKWCNENNALIEDKGDYFEVIKIPAPTEKELAQQEIQELQQKLADTDYISNKLAEAVSKYIATGDNTEVVELRTKYSKELEDRQTWRNRINQLEVQNGL